MDWLEWKWKYSSIEMECDEPGYGSTLLKACSFCLKMTLPALCSPAGYQHARCGEDLWRVQHCQDCRKKLWPSTTYLLEVFERLDTGREGLKGITLRIEQSKSGSVLKAYLDGKVLAPEISGRPLICYVTVEEEDVASDFDITWEEERKYSGSEFHISRAKRWIKECRESHTQCELHSSNHMGHLTDQPITLRPSRLLHLSLEDGESAQLVDVASQIGSLPHYATLSYCWGPNGLPTSAKTTTENFLERQAGFNTNTLPKTFRDAMDATRRLGLEYLWIDALCIIQGSIEDWRKEGKAMDAIYSRSTVTLAAESSSDANGGLYTVDTVEFEENISRLATTLSDGRSATLLFRAIDPDRLRRDNRALSTRAWCLQERVLSRRILHFFDEGILWECRRQYELWHDPTIVVPWECEGIGHYGARYGKALMGGPEEWMEFQKEELLLEQRSVTSLAQLEEVRQLIREDPFDLPRWHLFRKWYKDLVPEYSARRLTFFSDKLPAISSIARALHRHTNSDYLAGIWAEEIAMGLAWSPGDPQNLNITAAPGVIPEPTPRPSWSWQSYPFEVWWEMRLIHSNSWNGGPNTCVQSYIQLLSHDMDLVSDDPFGEVRSGRLHIRGKALPGDHIVLPGEGENKWGLFSMRFVNRDGSVRAWPPKQTDSLPTEATPTGNLVDESSNTICLLLCSFVHDTFFLVLRRVGEPNIYERKSLLTLGEWNGKRWHRYWGMTDGEMEEWEYWVANGEERDFVLV